MRAGDPLASSASMLDDGAVRGYLWSQLVVPNGAVQAYVVPTSKPEAKPKPTKSKQKRKRKAGSSDDEDSDFEEGGDTGGSDAGLPPGAQLMNTISYESALETPNLTLIAHASLRRHVVGGDLIMPFEIVPSQLLILESVGRRRHRGLFQSQLTALGISPSQSFPLVKNLEQGRLLVRIPYHSKMMRTNLLLLPQFAQAFDDSSNESEQDNAAGLQGMTRASVDSFRSAIVAHLQGARNGTLSLMNVRQLMVRARRHIGLFFCLLFVQRDHKVVPNLTELQYARFFKREIAFLVSDGAIDKFVTMVDDDLRICVSYIKAYVPGSAAAAPPAPAASAVDTSYRRVPYKSLELQIYELAREGGTTGVTGKVLYILITIVLLTLW